MIDQAATPLEAARRRAGLSFERLGAAAGVAPLTVKRLCRGLNTPKRTQARLVAVLASLLEVPAAELAAEIFPDSADLGTEAAG